LLDEVHQSNSVPWTPAGTLKKTIAFIAVEEPWNSVINTVN
jgi:hypothetical protein